MERGLKRLLGLMILLFLTACNGSDPQIDGPEDSGTIGTVEFDFELKTIRIPVSGIRRIDLSIATSAYHLYRGDFIRTANVSDLIRNYSFRLEEGEYYYQAGITCVCAGDTCLWEGFPGGQFGTKWTAGTIEIVKGEVLRKKLTFQ